MDLKTILLVIHVLLAIGLIGFILLQHGKGADAGAAFGSGASSTVFGARGSSSFLSRTTAYLATLFFVVSFTLYFLAVQEAEQARKGAPPPVQPVPKRTPGTSSDSTPTPKGAAKKPAAKTDSSPAPKSGNKQAGPGKPAAKKDSSPEPKKESKKPVSKPASKPEPKQ